MASIKREELEDGDKLESGDRVEVEMSIESKNDYTYFVIEDMKPAGMEPVDLQSGYSWAGLSAYREFRDEKVAFFVSYLRQGDHTLTYELRAEVPGVFQALPTQIHAMYVPEIRGNSENDVIAIDEAAEKEATDNEE